MWWLIGGLAAAWLLWMTLRPNPEVAANLEVLTEPAAAQGISRFWLIDIAGNIVVFAPFGAAVTLAIQESAQGTASAHLPAVWGTLAGLILSVAIETLQGLTASRVPSLGDTALNTLGALTGAWLALWICRPGSAAYRR